MTRVIAVTGGKGGVGKTTVTANLGAALNEFGQRTLVIDTNLTTPNLGFHLGVPLYPKTLHDVLRGEADVDEAMYVHPSGLKVIPAGISMSDLKNTKPDKLQKAVTDAADGHDVVFLDCAAGLGREAVAGLKSADELLIVTNPQLPAVTDALKTIKLAEELGVGITGVVLNRVRGHSSELSSTDIESLLGHPIIASIPEDHTVHDSLAAKTPITAYAPSSKSAVEMKRLAAKIGGIEWQPPTRGGPAMSIFERIFSFLKI